MTERFEIAGPRWALLLAACGCLVLGVAVIAGGALDTDRADRLSEARRLEAEGDLVKAIAVYEGVLLDDADEIEAVRGMAVDLALLGRFDEALPYQERTVGLDPDDAQTRVELAFNYLNHQDEPSKGLRFMDEAALLDPSPRNRTFLAQALQLNGQDSSAIALLEGLVLEHPEYQYAKVVLERILAGLGVEPTSPSTFGAREVSAPGFGQTRVTSQTAAHILA